jgi:hypothetical protein
MKIYVFLRCIQALYDGGTLEDYLKTGSKDLSLRPQCNLIFVLLSSEAMDGRQPNRR